MKIQKEERLFIMPQQISNQLKCIICSEVFYDPMRIVCGHVFCKSCIEQWTIKENKKNCPQCRKTLAKKDKPKKDFVIDSIISELNVRCKFHPEKCGWKGQLDKYSSHQNECVGDIIPQFTKKNAKQGDDIDDMHLAVDPGNLMARVLGQLDRQYINIAYAMNTTKSSEANNQSTQLTQNQIDISIQKQQEYILEQIQKKVKSEQDNENKLNEQLTQSNEPFSFKNEKQQYEEKVEIKTSFQDENYATQQNQQLKIEQNTKDNEQMKNMNIWERMEMRNKQKKNQYIITLLFSDWLIILQIVYKE
ncbi:hypothetical protein pb186bvf_006832 [Paramecium bursaria]